jgi:hypothetical protein
MRCRFADSLGHNLIGNGSGGAGFSASDLVGTSLNPLDPRLGPLQDNGGPTPTMALLPGSPAIDAGGLTDSEWDQRGPGYPRLVNGTTDIGAYEVQPDSGAASPPQAEYFFPRMLRLPQAATTPATWLNELRAGPHRANILLRPVAASADRCFASLPGQTAGSIRSLLHLGSGAEGHRLPEDLFLVDEPQLHFPE